MDEISAKVLNWLQYDFPLETRPFRGLADSLDIDEEEVLEIVRRLKESGYIRRFGGVFDSKKLGYRGTLCSMKVPEERIREVAATVNGYPEVTHNYIRTDPYNMWFTITAFSEERIREILDQIRDRTGISDLVRLDSKRAYKVRVNFNVGGTENE